MLCLHFGMENPKVPQIQSVSPRNRIRWLKLSSFKKWLQEEITIIDGELSFAFNTNSKSSLVNTNLGKSAGKKKFIPRQSKAKQFGGVTVFSVYSAAKGSSVILKSIKKQSVAGVSKKEYDKFLTRTAIFMTSSKGGMLKDTDVIISPQTSSFLLSDLLDKIHQIRPKIKMIQEAFIKSNVDKIIIDYSNFDISDKVKASMIQLLKNAKQNGFIELKKIPKQFLKYISNVLNVDRMKVLPKYIDNKNVVIIDDVLASGFTMKEMIFAMKIFSPKSIHGITMFKT